MEYTNKIYKVIVLDDAKTDFYHDFFMKAGPYGGCRSDHFTYSFTYLSYTIKADYPEYEISKWQKETKRFTDFEEAMDYVKKEAEKAFKTMEAKAKANYPTLKFSRNNGFLCLDSEPFKIDDSKQYNPYLRIRVFEDSEVVSVYDSYGNTSAVFDSLKEAKDMIMLERDRKGFGNLDYDSAMEKAKKDPRILSDEPITSNLGYVGGYKGKSMSNSAYNAESNGSLPLSRWNKDNIIDEISSDGELDFMIDILKELPVSKLREICLYEDGYHHTGKYYNQTVFYSIRSPRDIFERCLSERII